MKTISKYLLLLAAAVFTFTACEKTVEREPSPLDAPGAVLFASAGGTFELNMSKDPLETTVTLFRTSNLDQADTINLEATAHPVFQFDPKVIFAPGDKKVDLKITFATGEADSTYTMKLTMPEGKVSPYLNGQSEFNYTVKLVLWSELRTGIWVDDAVVASTFNIPASTAWTVGYQVAENADGSQKIRVINPYACTASGVDENGVYDGFPFNDPGDWDTSKDYNIEIFISADNDVTMPDVELGVDWGYTMMKLVNYNGVEAHGDFDPAARRITFDKTAAKNTLVFAMDKPYNYAGYRFYLSYAAYLADQPVGPEPVDATVETYEGAWTIKALDLNTDEQVSANVTVTSYEDPTEGQYYVLEGLYADIPAVYGYFDEETHMFKLQTSRGNTVVIDEKNYEARLYMLDADYRTSATATLDIIPGEGGTLAVNAESEAVAFVIVYINLQDQSDYKFGDGMYQISFEPANAAGAPARKAVAPKRVNGKKMLLPALKLEEKIR